MDRINHRYSHYNSYSFSLDSYSLSCDYKRPDIVENRLSAALDSFIEVYRDACGYIEKYGYSIIDYEYTEDFICELFECNEYKFLANGDQY